MKNFEPEGNLIRMHYDIQNLTYREFWAPYYTSQAGRLVSRHEAYNGLKVMSLGQFQFERSTAEMITTPDRYHADKARFLHLCLKAIRRLAVRAIAQHNLRN